MTLELSDLVSLMLEASKQLDASLAEHKLWAERSAQADQHYRLKRSQAYLKTEGTVAEREAQTELQVSDERYRAQLAEGLERSALEAVRGARQKLSALQSVSAVVREEVGFARTGPDFGP